MAEAWDLCDRTQRTVTPPADLGPFYKRNHAILSASIVQPRLRSSRFSLVDEVAPDNGRWTERTSVRGSHEAVAHQNLDLLPADFAYRKFDRLLDHAGKPERVVTHSSPLFAVTTTSCFWTVRPVSLLTQSIFAAADAVLVPTIPTVLSLRMVARLIKWADRSDSRSELAAFFSMVDRRNRATLRPSPSPGFGPSSSNVSNAENRKAKKRRRHRRPGGSACWKPLSR
jgi:hypothetical protein